MVPFQPCLLHLCQVQQQGFPGHQPGITALPCPRFDIAGRLSGLPCKGGFGHHAAGCCQVVEAVIDGCQTSAQPAVECFIAEFALQELQLCLSLRLLDFQVFALHFCGGAADSQGFQLGINLFHFRFGIIFLDFPFLTAAAPCLRLADIIRGNFGGRGCQCDTGTNGFRDTAPAAAPHGHTEDVRCHISSGGGYIQHANGCTQYCGREVQIHGPFFCGTDIFIIQGAVAVKAGLRTGTALFQCFLLGIQLSECLLLHPQGREHQLTGLVLQQFTHRFRIPALNQSLERGTELHQLSGQ